MFFVFNLEELKCLLKDFYCVTKIHVSIFDSKSKKLISYPENDSHFCTLIRATYEGYIACTKCDGDACAIAVQQNKPYIYRCHAGLTEVVMPLYVNTVLVGYIFFGQVFAYNSFDEGWKFISESCKNYKVDFAELEESCAEFACVSDEYIQSAVKILQATASYLVLKRMVTLQEGNDEAKLDTYISAHYTEPITSKDLCQKLHIDRSKLYKLSARLYGCGISQYIKRLRIDRAKYLLTDCLEMSLTEIAEACGYQDYNYFIAVFSKTVGKSPYAFRKNAIKKLP